MHKESNTIIHLELLQECSEKVGCIFSGVYDEFQRPGSRLNDCYSGSLFDLIVHITTTRNSVTLFYTI